MSKEFKKYNRPKRLLPNGMETCQQEDIRRIIRSLQDIMVEGAHCCIARGPDDGPFSNEFLSKAQLDFETILLNLTGHTLSQITLALASVLDQRASLKVPYGLALDSEEMGIRKLLTHDLDIPI